MKQNHRTIENKRSMCKECPWRSDARKSDLDFRKKARSFQERKITAGPHRCHMISTDLWRGVNPDNICKGSECL